MSPSSYDALAAYILTVDKSVVGYLLPTTFFFALGLVILFTRKRTWIEMIAIFVATYLCLLVASGLLFHFGLDRPFFRLEVIDF